MLKTKDNVELFTQSWKAADPKAVIVLTHGFNDHSSRFAHVGQALSAAGYSVYAYDLRGHGKSGGPRGHAPAFEYFLDDLALVIAEVKREQPNKKLFLYGHSMGGNATLNYALRHPEGLSGVLATDPWLKLAFDPPAIQVILATLISKLKPDFTQKINLDRMQLSRDQSVGEAYQKDPLLHGIISARAWLDLTHSGLEAIEQAAGLKLPVLLLHGADDKITSLAATQSFYQSAGALDKTFKTYEGMRHEIHNEFGKEEVLADIIAWLNKHC